MQTEGENDPSTLGHVRDAQAGAQSAWTRLAAKIDDELRPRLTRRCVPPPFDADDVVQIVSVEVFRSIGKIDPSEEHNFRAWIRAICKLRLVDLWRHSRSRRQGDAIPLDALEFDLPDAQATPPSEIARTHEAEQRVAKVVENLNQRHRDVLRLREEEARTYAEIATELTLLSEQAARNLYAYARRRRGELMRDYYDTHIC